MKKLRLLSACLTLFAAIGFTGCSEEDPSMMEGGPGTNVNSGIFKVHYNDGVQYVADDAMAIAAVGTITITGSVEETGEVITMSLTGNTLGTYNDVNFSYVFGDEEYTNVNPANGVKSGVIKITGVNTANHTISGEFSFIGYPDGGGEAMPFYNGMFTNVSYTGALPEPVNPTNPTTQYLKAKIDGTLMEFPTIMSLPNMGTFMISGTNTGAAKTMVLMLNEADIAVGTFPLVDSPFDGFTSEYTDLAGQNSYTSVEGTVTITSYANGWVTGTFQYTGEDMDGNQKVITEGQFNIDLP